MVKIEDSKQELVDLSPKEKKIADRVLLMLGAPVLKVEIGYKEIKELIQTAVDVVEPYNVESKFITRRYAPTIDLSDEGIIEVLRVMPATDISSNDVSGYGEEYTFDFTAWTYLDRLDKQNVINMISKKVQPDIDIPFEFDENTQILMPKAGITYGNITAECIPEIVSVEDFRDKATLKWIYCYTLALAKGVVGRIRSKAKSPNVPIELDGDQLLTEYQSDKDALELSLMSDGMGGIAVLR